MKRIISTILAIVCLQLMGVAQIMNPVHFTTQLKQLEGDEGELLFTANIEPGWHVYSTGLGSDGPVSATFGSSKMEGAETVGPLKARGKEIKQFDTMFNQEVRFFERSVTFVQKIRFTKPHYDIECYVEYGACNDQSCLPPSQADLKAQGEWKGAGAQASTNDGKAKDNVAEQPETPTETVPDTTATQPLDAAVQQPVLTDSALLWQPVTAELSALNNQSDGQSQGGSLLSIFIWGFVGGLLAVCMPCIWPIIPMTVTFFLKRAKTSRSRGLRDAIAYGLSIIVIYLTLGLLVTAIFGSDALNAMSTSAVFNVLLFLLLVVFALSFFGWFELRLPDSWANSVDTKATQTSGLLSILLMAFTLVLVSFSCTAPIIGLLLVEAATSADYLSPAVGMFGFALALALPFTLFALFPTWLKQAPKSGSWMTKLKVVLAFIELAFSLKFLSVADLANGWHILDREVFLSLWIVIFGLLGAYLCGWLKFQVDDEGEPSPTAIPRPMPVVCIMGGLVSLAFAIYMVPGLWGAPCKAVSAFAPPLSTQDFCLGAQAAPEAEYTDYEAGMAAARAQGKPVLLDFTGYGCVNCRKMEAAVWADPSVSRMIRNDFVLISLYVDDKTALPHPMQTIDAQGQPKTLGTVGKKWSHLQSSKFGANAQPFYVIVDPATAKPLTGSRAYDENVAAYVDFLQQGLRNYQKKN